MAHTRRSERGEETTDRKLTRRILTMKFYSWFHTSSVGEWLVESDFAFESAMTKNLYLVDFLCTRSSFTCQCYLAHATSSRGSRQSLKIWRLDQSWGLIRCIGLIASSKRVPAIENPLRIVSEVPDLNDFTFSDGTKIPSRHISYLFLHTMPHCIAIGKFYEDPLKIRFSKMREAFGEESRNSIIESGPPLFWPQKTRLSRTIFCGLAEMKLMFCAHFNELMMMWNWSRGGSSTGYLGVTTLLSPESKHKLECVGRFVLCNEIQLCQWWHVIWTCKSHWHQLEIWHSAHSS